MRNLQRALGEGTWIRKAEHSVLRLVSLAFSLASAHAIRLVFAPLDGVDPLQPVITWITAIGFGVLGYFVSRGLTHRFMNKEPILAYAPICLVVEMVEVFCNYVLAASVIQRATWLDHVPETQRVILTVVTYIVLSCIPLVSLLLAVVDMDLERGKQHPVGVVPSPVGNSLPPVRPLAPNRGANPKVVGQQQPGAARWGAPAPAPVAGTGASQGPRLPGVQSGQPQGGVNGAIPLAGITP